MKLQKKLFRVDKDNIDPEKIKNYYVHEAQDHCLIGHSQSVDNEHQATNKYKCPMNCEGNKTYDAPGRCPICNMNLTMVG